MIAVSWGLVGNAWAVDLLRRQLERGTTHHAYLFTGPEGVGRARLALAFAQTILCEAPPRPGEWCGACRACRQVPERRYPDLHWVERPQDKQGITIEQGRELQRQLALTPMAGGRRVAILVGMDEASEGAANALLKTLEEPPPRVYLLVCAGDVEEVPPTIVSRCEVLALRPVPVQVIAEALEAHGADKAKAEELAGLADGRPELALRMLAEPALHDRRRAYAGELQEVLRLGLAGRFAVAEQWREDDQLEQRLGVWVNLLGEAMRRDFRESSGGRTDGSWLPDPKTARSALDATLRSLEALRRNANARLALEVLMLDLPRSGAGSSRPA